MSVSENIIQIYYKVTGATKIIIIATEIIYLKTLTVSVAFSFSFLNSAICKTKAFTIINHYLKFFLILIHAI